MNLIQNNVLKIDSFNLVDPQQSQLINAGTVEGLLHYMSKLGSAISFFDESSQFLGSFGRYNGGSAQYERSIYLTLANAKEDFRRDLKTERTSIIKPRLNICINSHPFSFIEAYSYEKNSYDDGLFQRFFVSCPEPTVYLSSEIMSTSVPKISLLCIFYYIYKKHSSQNISMNLSHDANVKFNNFYDLFRTLHRDGRI